MRLIMIRNRDNEQLPQSYCDFKAPGGTIGRGTDNTLILPDQTRAISRLQAIVHVSPAGEAAITHRGSTTALLLNGRELPHNLQQPLAEGDMLDIGGYQFSVTLQVSDTPPTLPLAASVTAPGKGIHDAVWDQLEAEFLSSTPLTSKPIPFDPEHPLFLAGQNDPAGKDPLALAKERDLASLQEKSTDPTRLFEADDTLSHPTIMNDTTPSVLLMQTKWAAPQEEQPDEPAPSAVQQAPALFSQADELSAGWGLNTGNASDDDDPVGLFLSNAVPLTSALEEMGDFSSELPPWPSEPVALATTDIPLPETAAQHPVEPPLPPQQHQPEDLAWATSPIIPEETLSLDNAMFYSAPPEQMTAETEELPPQRARMGIDPVRHQPFQPAKSSSQEQLQGELFSAFVAGLGLDDAPVTPDFSPEQLYMAGKLLSLFSQGTVALLSSRSILKRGLKAEMTMILEEENNPFKMLPSGKTVLMQIFSTPMPGFTPAENAVRDAMIDLQAHQLGMIAGVRAIIAAMLQTFHPDTLEKMAVEQGNGKGLFPANRKAVLWDMLKIRYQQVANEVEDDFHTLFGEAFLHAYDLEIRQYKASQNRKDP